MADDCREPITHIGEKGYIYCSCHAARRRASGYERCRKLRPFELRILAAGDPLPSYEPLTKAETHARLAPLIAQWMRGEA